MPLEQDLKKRLMDAMRAKDLRTADAIRMVNTKVMERRTAKGFSGQVDDALIVEVIGSYRKSLQKAQAEFVAAGDKGKEPAAELAWEIDFLVTLLPDDQRPVSAEVVRAAVDAAIATLGRDPKLAGRIVGEVVKQHKGRVDASDVKRLVDEALAGS